MKKKKSVNSENYDKWLKIAAWAPIASIVLTIVFSIVFQIVAFSANPENMPLGLTLSQSIITFILGVLFSFGFYKIGEKYNSKLLRVVMVLMVLLSLITIILQYSYFNFASEELLLNFNEKVQAFNNTIQYSDTSADDVSDLFFASLFQDSQFVSSFSTIIGSILIYLLISGILSILMGCALIKLKGKIPLAKPTGILLIVGVATSIILVGFIVLFAAWIMQVILMFKEAYKK